MTITLGTKTEFTAAGNAGSPQTQAVTIAVDTNMLVVCVTIYDTSSSDGDVAGITGYNGAAPVSSFQEGATPQYDALCDGHVSIWYLIDPSTDIDEIRVVFGGTVTDFKAVVQEVNGTLGTFELETDGGKTTGTGGTDEPITAGMSHAGDAILFGAMLDDQTDDAKVTMVDGVALYIEDIGDVVSAAYRLVTGSGTSSVKWADSDEDEDWVACGCVFKEVSSGVTVDISAAISLAGSAPSMSITKGAVTVDQNTAITLVGSASLADVYVAQIISATGAISLAGSVSSADVYVAQIIDMTGAITLVGSVPSTSLLVDRIISITGAITLAGSVSSASLLVDRIISITGAITLAGSVPTGGVTPGAVTIDQTGAITLAGSISSVSVYEGMELANSSFDESDTVLFDMTNAENTVLVVFVMNDAADSISGVVYNGVDNLTNYRTTTGTNNHISLWAIENPTQRSGNIVASGGSGNEAVYAFEYVGAVIGWKFAGGTLASSSSMNMYMSYTRPDGFHLAACIHDVNETTTFTSGVEVDDVGWGTTQRLAIVTQNGDVNLGTINLSWSTSAENESVQMRLLPFRREGIMESTGSSLNNLDIKMPNNTTLLVVGVTGTEPNWVTFNSILLEEKIDVQDTNAQVRIFTLKNPPTDQEYSINVDNFNTTNDNIVCAWAISGIFNTIEHSDTDIASSSVSSISLTSFDADYLITIGMAQVYDTVDPADTIDLGSNLNKDVRMDINEWSSTGFSWIGVDDVSATISVSKTNAADDWAIGAVTFKRGIGIYPPVIILAGSILSIHIEYPIEISITGAISLVGSTLQSTITPGEVTINQTNAITLAGSALFSDVSTADTGVTVNINAAITLAGSLPQLSAVPGEAIISQGSVITLTLSIPLADIQPGAVSITATNAITLVGSVLSSSAVPGEAVVSIGSAISLAGSAPSISVGNIVTISITGAITLAGSVPSVIITPGEIIVTQTGAITLAGSVLSINLHVDHIISVTGAITLAGTAPSISASADIIITMSGAIILVGSVVDSSVIPGEATVSQGSAITLVGLASSLTIIPGSVIVSVTGVVTLAGSASSLTVVPGEVIISAGAITLVGSALSSASWLIEALIKGDITIQLSIDGDVELVPSPSAIVRLDLTPDADQELEG